MSGNDSSARSARAKKQLRDSKGRFIEMGSKVRWFDRIDNKEQAGIVRELLDDGRAVIDRTDRPGGYVARVQAHLLEKIDEKATLDTPTDKPVIPTKTVKKNKTSHISGLNVSVSENSVTIEEPDGYGGGDTVYVSKNNLKKISDALNQGNTDKISLSSGTTVEISDNRITIDSRHIDPNDGTPGKLRSVSISKDSFNKILAESDIELEDVEVPDYSKMPKKAPEAKVTSEPSSTPVSKFTPPKLKPRHTLNTDSGKVEITDTEVKIFSEDGYGTGDSVYFSKDDFKKIIEEHKKKNKSGSPTIGGKKVTIRPDGSINFYSRYVNPNDGMPGPAKSVTISEKTINQIIDKIDAPLVASIWSDTKVSAEELPINSVLTLNNGINIQKVSNELWEYKTATNKISYNNNSIDAFKLIEFITFTVENN